MIYIPSISYRENGLATRSDIFSYMLSRRIILCSGSIDIELSNLIISQLLYLSSQDNKSDISMYINSPGGHVESGLAIFDIMNQIDPEIKTICMGTAYSMGAMLLLLGTKGKRYALEHSSVMIHQPSIYLGKGGSFKETELTLHQKKMKETRSLLVELIHKQTDKPIEQIELDIENDNFMTSKEALEYGIVDHIGVGKASAKLGVK